MSDTDGQIIQLLREIRAGQQEQLALYRETTQSALRAQQTALQAQLRTARLYRIVVAVGAVVMAGLIYYLFTLST
jgi:hypothetical protein